MHRGFVAAGAALTSRRLGISCFSNQQVSSFVRNPRAPLKLCAHRPEAASLTACTKPFIVARGIRNENSTRSVLDSGLVCRFHQSALVRFYASPGPSSFPSSSPLGGSSWHAPNRSGEDPQRQSAEEIETNILVDRFPFNLVYRSEQPYVTPVYGHRRGGDSPLLLFFALALLNIGVFCMWLVGT